MVQTASLFGMQHVIVAARQYTVYGDMHYEDLMGSIIRIVYCIKLVGWFIHYSAFSATKAMQH